MKKRIVVVFLIMAVLTAVFSQFVYADSACPKGKECTTPGCGRYSDANGNSVCDIAEGTTASGSSPVQQSESSSVKAAGDSGGTYDYTASLIESNPILIVYAAFLITAAILYKMNLSVNKRDRLRLLLLALSLGILGFWFGGCICPIGALQNLPLKLAGVASGQYVGWLILLLLPIAFIFLAGRIFCSSVCPLGAVQEWVFRIGRKLGLNNGKPGMKGLSWLRYVKYAVLAWLVVFTAMTGYTLFCSYDPFLTLFALKGTLISIALLAVVLSASLFISRPWCRIICPYGALLGIVNKAAGKRDRMKCSSCSGCGLCTVECPTDAIIITKNGGKASIPEINYFECINCKKCR